MYKFITLSLLVFTLGACSSTKVNYSHEANAYAQLDEPQANTFLRADPSYINWLEKQSLLRQAPEKIRIVSGTSLAWKSPTKTLATENNTHYIAKISPVWFYTNPLLASPGHNYNYIQNFLSSNTPQHLKKIGIHAGYIAPMNKHGFQVTLHPAQKQNKAASSSDNAINTANMNEKHSPISYDFAENIANEQSYQRLNNLPFVIGSDMLSPSIGLGPDFILALHAVREYPGLFMMTELPQAFWEHFPEKVNTSIYDFSPYVLNEKDKEFLFSKNILPPSFIRDLFGDSEEYGFALSAKIRGIDSMERRWIYRFAQDPKNIILNINDPSLSAQRLFTASIIQQVGILRQPLIGISLKDLWGQEGNDKLLSSIDTHSADHKILAKAQFAKPALTALKVWNDSIHGYGAWSMIKDAFPLEFIPLIQGTHGELSDFVADTIFMPALEEALLAENATKLKDNIKQALEQNIVLESLWRGSPDVYTDYFIEKPFHSLTSMDMATKMVGLENNERKQLQQLLTLPKDLQDNKQLLEKFEDAQDIQFAYLAFSAYLPGISFISPYDIRGIIPSGNQLPLYSLGMQDTNNTKNTALFPPLARQLKEKNSLINKLAPLYTFRQEHQLAVAKIMEFPDSDDKSFAVHLKNSQGKHYLILTNLAPESHLAIIDIKDKKNFRMAKNPMNQQTNHIRNNRLKIRLKAWEVVCLELR